MTALLRADRLYRFFDAGEDQVLALKGVSLTVATGEIVAVLGPSGSGKSTLLSCLAGIDEPQGGTVWVADERVTRRPETERAGRRARLVGMLFQHGNLVEHLTMEANLVAVQALSGRHDRTRRDLLLERLGLSDCRHRMPSQLSGGELVRAGLAVALANDPPLLLADEPTAEVDVATESEVIELLRDSIGPKRAVVVSTHSDAVAAAADRVVRLVDGEVVA